MGGTFVSTAKGMVVLRGNLASSTVQIPEDGLFPFSHLSALLRAEVILKLCACLV